MPDLSAGGTQRSLSRRIINGVWFSKRTGFRVFCLGAFINLILFSLFLFCTTPVYETNDDLMMQLIASGFYTGHPDAHLVFTNILVGWILRFLYAIWAGCNWYLIYLLIVHYAAFTAIAFVVMSRWFSWVSAWLYVGFVLLVEPHNLIYLQFTTTAFLAGTAGLLLLVDGLQPGQPLNWPKTIAGVIFVGLHGLGAGTRRVAGGGGRRSFFIGTVWLCRMASAVGSGSGLRGAMLAAARDQPLGLPKQPGLGRIFGI